jgi:hypothetical protein
MFVASYYPRMDTPTELCAGPGSGPVFTGTQSCQQTLACVQTAGADGLAAEACLLNTCAASSPATVELMKCINFQCSTACAEGEAACNQCVITTCDDEFSGCYNVGC